MTDTTGGLPPAGWYPDPYGAPVERWWDGAGWTEHTNAAAPVVEEQAPRAPEFVEPAPTAYPSVESEQAAYEPVAYEPVAYEPVAYGPVAYEPIAYQPPPLEEPPAPAADPFSGFVSPAEPAPYAAPAQSYEPEPESAAPVFGGDLFGQPEPTANPEQYMQPDTFSQPDPYAQPDPFAQQQAFPPAQSFPQAEAFSQAEAFPQPTPAAQPTNPGGGNAPSSFDFGFGNIIAGSEAPSNDSVPAQPGEDGLFGSWEPNEYSEPLRNGPANVGLTLGVLSFFLSALVGLPGLILSAVGIGRSARFASEGAGPVGRGKAIAGVALSVVGSAVSAALLLYGLQLYNASQQPSADEVPDDSADQAQVGELDLEIGDMGTITLPGSDAAAIQFTVTAITPNFTCTAAEAVSPENGQFVAVAMDFTLSPEYLTRMADSLPLHMFQSDWIGFVGDESATQVDSTDAGNSCISAEEQFPTDFPAGENVSGMIVLDMAVGTASVSYSPSGVTDLDPGMTRWEWIVPA